MTFNTFLHVNCSPIDLVTASKLGYTHLQDVSECTDILNCGKSNSHIVAPMAIALNEMADYFNGSSNTVYSVSRIDDRFKLNYMGAENESLVIEGEKIHKSYNIDENPEVLASLGIAYAITSDDMCANAFRLFCDKKDIQSLAIANKIILDYMDKMEICVVISNKEFTFEKNTFVSLKAVIRKVENDSLGFLKKPETAKEKPAAITNKFSDEQFIEKNSFTVNPKYTLDEQLNAICNAVYNGDVSTVLLHGPAGTGKSITAKLICKAIELPVVAVLNCSSNTDDFVLGKYVAEGDKTYFRESKITKAIRNGGAVIFEEINFAKPQHIIFLNSLLDDNGFVYLDNGDIVRRHKLFRFFATMNDGYAGASKLNEALLNRMNVVHKISEVPEWLISEILLNENPDCEKYLDNIMAVYRKCRTAISDSGSSCPLSIRNLISWVRVAKYENFRTAADHTMLSAALEDEELCEAFRKIFELYKW